MKKFTEEEKKRITQEIVKFGEKKGFPSGPKKDKKKK